MPLKQKKIHEHKLEANVHYIQYKSYCINVITMQNSKNALDHLIYNSKCQLN